MSARVRASRPPPRTRSTTPRRRGRSSDSSDSAPAGVHVARDTRRSIDWRSLGRRAPLVWLGVTAQRGSDAGTRCGTWFPLRADLERAVRFATFHLLAAGSIDGSDRRDRPTRPTAAWPSALTGNGLSRARVLGHRRVRRPRVVGHRALRRHAAHSNTAGPVSGRREHSTSRRTSRSAIPVGIGGRRHRGDPDDGPRPAREPPRSAPVSRRLHITADVAWAVGNHVAWTGDDEFLAVARPGTARRDRAVLGVACRDSIAMVSAHLRGVIGPDEYHEDVDDNVFTNVMVRHNLDLAAEVAARFGGCDPTELVTWRRLAEALEVASTSRALRAVRRVRRTRSAVGRRDRRPPLSADALLGRDTIAQTADHQATRCDDGVPPRATTCSTRPRSSATCVSPRSVRPTAARCPRRSRGRCSSGPAMARGRGLLELAAFLDLDDLTGTTAGGLHLATMGGLWQAMTVGMLGLRPTAAGLAVDPRVPPDLGPMRHRVMFRGHRSTYGCRVTTRAWRRPYEVRVVVVGRCPRGASTRPSACPERGGSSDDRTRAGGGGVPRQLAVGRGRAHGCGQCCHLAACRARMSSPSGAASHGRTAHPARRIALSAAHVAPSSVRSRTR